MLLREIVQSGITGSAAESRDAVRHQLVNAQRTLPDAGTCSEGGPRCAMSDGHRAAAATAGSVARRGRRRLPRLQSRRCRWLVVAPTLAAAAPVRRHRRQIFTESYVLGEIGRRASRRRRTRRLTASSHGPARAFCSALKGGAIDCIVTPDISGSHTEAAGFEISRRYPAGSGGMDLRFRRRWLQRHLCSCRQRGVRGSSTTCILSAT